MEYLDGDGDFRSKEVTRFRDQADFIITNPPFSLFREFLKWIVDGGKLIIQPEYQRNYIYNDGRKDVAVILGGAGM